MNASLRQRAEELARAGKAPRGPKLSPEEMQEKLHELLVHQIELEMQNEALRQSQEDLEAVRARYFDLYDMAPIGYVTLNEQGLILEANTTVASMLGVHRSLLVNQPISRFIFKEDQDHYYRHRKHLVASGEPHSCTQRGCELRLVNQEGISFWAQIETKSAQEADGEFVHLTMVSDISARKQAEQETVKAQEYLANILNSMPSAMIGIDLQCVVTHWNRAAEEATGTPARLALGRPLEDAFPRLLPQMDTIRAALRDRTPQNTKREVFIRNGVRSYQDVMIYPLVTEDIVGAVVRVDDVTRRVQIDEMMVQSEKMMSVGGLAAGMAHEINNPLSGILQSAQVVISHLQPDVPANRIAAEASGCSMDSIQAYLNKRQIPEFMEAINQSGARAAQIVSNMLEFCRKGDVPQQAADINALLDKAVELSRFDYDLKKKYDFKTITIVREYAQDLPEVYCTCAEIEQVALNLLKNAAQALVNQDAITSKPTITLRTALDGGLLRIEVEDNGIGMTDAVRKRAFEPFFTTKGVGEGTGLGLAVSYFIIVTKHGGSFDVQSQPGIGTRFIMRIPFSPDQTDAWTAAAETHAES
ncbi:Sporulation kinase E [Fundidesulfovibrio magnetotacticus]|uniref:histidine kinase n=1 Tax=Fundidesulfovibrio magnetotacticus TaxID=2730080 RepID=A0A6V8LP66_9BACT|nr:PAS domain-containing sensor histidine kinase [Fundidesulfovibrio magnetotacticus]GFK93514.1 Sporulation kinase E [Fundidesulfovibrio magnetotacticus]